MSEGKSAPANPPPAPAANGGKLASLNSPLFIWTATVVLAALLFFGLSYLIDTFTAENTDDAFIAAHIVSVAPRVSGQVSAVYVLDNQMVRSNDPLVEIDPSTYNITVAQKQSAAASQDSNVKTVLAVDQLMRQKVGTAGADLNKAQADADAADATAKRADADFQRMDQLRKQNTVSQQEFDAAQAAAAQADADSKAAQANVASESSKVDEAKTQLTAAEAEVGLATAQWQEAQTNVASAQLDLSYTKIFAPCDGRITRKQVEAGDYLQTGQMILSLVSTDVWVVANFKETQLKDVKPGQPVSVTIDALDRTFRAHVDSVQAGSGAAFSLLPPENATGNYVKVVQRVPVKILFDEPLPADKTIGPGLSVEPIVQISPFRVPEIVTAIVAIILAVAAAAGFKAVLNRKAS